MAREKLFIAAILLIQNSKPTRKTLTVNTNKSNTRYFSEKWLKDGTITPFSLQYDE